MDSKDAANFLVQIISTNGIIRSESLENSLRKNALTFSISPGIVPTDSDFRNSKLHERLISSLVCQRSLSKSEVGCVLAHRTAAQNLIESDFPFGIIFEDDAEIIQPIDSCFLAKILNSEAPRIIQLGWLPGYAVALSDDLQPFPNFKRLITPATCAFAYALNRAAAELLANKSYKVADIPDWPIHLHNKVEFYVTAEQIAMAPQDPALSLIGVRPSLETINLNSKIYSRFKLLISLPTLIIAAKIKRLNFGTKQILNRLILLNLFYNFAKNQLNAQEFNQDENLVSHIVYLKPNLVNLMKFFHLI